MGPRARLDGRKISSPLRFDPGPSSPESVAIPTELPSPHTCVCVCVCVCVRARARALATVGPGCPYLLSPRVNRKITKTVMMDGTLADS